MRASAHAPRPHLWLPSWSRWPGVWHAVATNCALVLQRVRRRRSPGGAPTLEAPERSGYRARDSMATTSPGWWPVTVTMRWPPRYTRSGSTSAPSSNRWLPAAWHSSWVTKCADRSSSSSAGPRMASMAARAPALPGSLAFLDHARGQSLDPGLQPEPHHVLPAASGLSEEASYGSAHPSCGHFKHHLKRRSHY